MGVNIQLNIGETTSVNEKIIQYVKYFLSSSFSMVSKAMNEKYPGIRKHAIATTKADAYEIIITISKKSINASAIILGFNLVFS